MHVGMIFIKSFIEYTGAFNCNSAKWVREKKNKNDNIKIL